MSKKLAYTAIVFAVVAIIVILWQGTDLGRDAHTPPNDMADPGRKQNKQTEDEKEQQTIDDLIAEMTLAEKSGQLLLAGISGTTLNDRTKTLIDQYKVGGLIFYASNLESPEQSVQMLNAVKSQNAHNRLPLLLGVDQEGGSVSRLPGLLRLPNNREIGDHNDPGLSYAIGVSLGKQLSAFGFNLNFSPVMDVDSNPENPVIGDRSFGTSPSLVAKLGIQTMKGMAAERVIAVIKHFPGHGDTLEDSHLKLPLVDKSLEQLEALELIPFQRAITEGADVVMVAHLLMPKLDSEFPASMSSRIITDLLRKQLRFSGVVITDDMTMGAITDHYEIGRAAVESFKAGSDIIMVAHEFDNVKAAHDALAAAVQQGEITETRINESLSRIIKLKRKYELNNNKVEKINTDQLNEDIKSITDRITAK